MKTTTTKARTCTAARGRNQQRKGRDPSALNADTTTTTGERGATVRFYVAGTDEVFCDLDLDADMYARIKRAAGESDEAVVGFIRAAIQWKLDQMDLKPATAGGNGKPGLSAGPAHHDDEDLIDRAITAYFRRFGNEANQPSRSSSAVEGGFVVLENVNGELARYQITKRGGLRYVEPDEEGGVR
jgi:hypothetical protein